MRTRLREMRPEDVPVIQELLKEQNERDATSYQMPPVFDENGVRLPSIPLALVAVDIQDGKVIQGHVWERTVELMSFGINAEATVCSMHEQEAIHFVLRERGYRDEHILVPANREADMRHGLEKIYRMTATGMTHFYRLLDPAENEELRAWYENREATV